MKTELVQYVIFSEVAENERLMAAIGTNGEFLELDVPIEVT